MANRLKISKLPAPHLWLQWGSELIIVIIILYLETIINSPLAGIICTTFKEPMSENIENLKLNQF